MAGSWFHRPGAQRSLGWGANLRVMNVEVVFEMQLGWPSKRKILGLRGEKRTWDEG